MSKIDENLFNGEFRRISIHNFPAYLDKIGVSPAKKKIALNAASFSNIITWDSQNNEITIVTKIKYGVDMGITTTETRYYN